MVIKANAGYYKDAGGVWQRFYGVARPAGSGGGTTTPVDPTPAPGATLGAIAEWNFTETSGGYKTTAGDLALVPGRGSPPRVATPFGYGVTLGSSVLRIAPESIGRLNLGARGINTVTVACWVRRTNTGTGFIAGTWQEDSNDPRRQYGLFVNLGTYGGANKSCMHVSKNGLPTPGYPFSRDYSASGQEMTNGVWELHVGTYDGALARSYLNGAFVGIPSYKDGLGNTYSKNPYAFADGLNGEPVEFTVGAVTLTSGYGNYFAGDLARLRVWDRALTASEISSLYATESALL